MSEDVRLVDMIFLKSSVTKKLYLKGFWRHCYLPVNFKVFYPARWRHIYFFPVLITVLWHYYP